MGRHWADVIISTTAFIGISIALIGGKGWEAADDWAALVACGFIVYNAYHIFRPVFGEIMDEAPAGTWAEDVRALAEAVPGVVATEKGFVRKMGFEYFADLHVIIDGRISVREGHAIAGTVKAAIKRAKPAVYNVLVHSEPQKQAFYAIPYCRKTSFNRRRSFYRTDVQYHKPVGLALEFGPQRGVEGAPNGRNNARPRVLVGAPREVAGVGQVVHACLQAEALPLVAGR